MSAPIVELLATAIIVQDENGQKSWKMTWKGTDTDEFQCVKLRAEDLEVGTCLILKRVEN